MRVPVRGLLGRRRPLVLALLVVAAVLVVVIVYPAARSGNAQPWTKVWEDGFNGAEGASPSSRNWLFDTGTSYPGGATQWGTGEIESYTRDPANVRLDGSGNLRITATRDASGAWRSGRIETRRADFQPSPGGELKVEARIRTPDGGPGYWPAFWMLGRSFRGTYTNWPQAGEIDVMENLGREAATVHGTLHCGTAPGGPCHENNGIGGAWTRPDGSALSAGFHTFAVEWDRSVPDEQIRWYVDGRRYFTVHAGDVGQSTWAEATHHGFFLVLNVAVGGGWPGPPEATTRPNRSMTVDRVSISRR